MFESRPSKKQRELLSFIDGFIKGNGYGPSYREIMRALDYKSVSTVAVHVDGLIQRGLLHKTDNSARSLEIPSAAVSPTSAESAHIEWLRKEIDKHEKLDLPSAKEETVVLREALAIIHE